MGRAKAWGEQREAVLDQAAEYLEQHDEVHTCERHEEKYTERYRVDPDTLAAAIKDRQAGNLPWADEMSDEDLESTFNEVLNSLGEDCPSCAHDAMSD